MPRLMKVIHEIHEVGGCAKTAGRRKVAGGLISPRTVERMFRNRQEFNVGEALSVNILREQRSHFPVGEPTIALLGDAPPRPKVHLVD